LVSHVTISRDVRVVARGGQVVDLARKLCARLEPRVGVRAGEKKVERDAALALCEGEDGFLLREVKARARGLGVVGDAVVDLATLRDERERQPSVGPGRGRASVPSGSWEGLRQGWHPCQRHRLSG